MSLAVYALTCGWLEGDLGHLMEGGEGRVRLPIPAYLIEHPNGTALFDTGMHPDCQSDPAARVGARIAGLFAFDYHPGEEISARLRALGRDPARVDLIINSHFHFDHCGGNGQIANATMLVQRREWEGATEPELAARHGFNPRDFDLGHKRRLPRFAFDKEAMRTSLDRLATLEQAGARIFFGHDPDFWAAVPQAPAPLAFRRAAQG